MLQKSFDVEKKNKFTYSFQFSSTKLQTSNYILSIVGSKKKTTTTNTTILFINITANTYSIRYTLYSLIINI